MKFVTMVMTMVKAQDNRRHPRASIPPASAPPRRRRHGAPLQAELRRYGTQKALDAMRPC
jgi:hypothetical protein